MRKDGCRPCKIHSHQFYTEGYFHIYMVKNNETFALIEGEYGNVSQYSMNDYHLEFTDREEV